MAHLPFSLSSFLDTDIIVVFLEIALGLTAKVFIHTTATMGLVSQTCMHQVIIRTLCLKSNLEIQSQFSNGHATLFNLELWKGPFTQCQAFEPC